MTREENLAWINRLRDEIDDGMINTSHDKEFVEALNYVVSWFNKAEYEPTVSLDSVLEVVYKLKSNYHDNREKYPINYGTLLDLIMQFRKLPTFTPQHISGQWIRERSLGGWDGGSYQCSICGRSIHLDPETETLEDYPYCHCGAIMQKWKHVL